MVSYPEGAPAAVPSGSLSSFQIRLGRLRHDAQAPADGSPGTYLPQVTLTDGSVAVGDHIQVEGRFPPVVGTVARLFQTEGVRMEVPRVTHGIQGSKIGIQIAGIAATDLPRGAMLVPSAAPVADAPGWSQPVGTTPVPGSTAAGQAESAWGAPPSATPAWSTPPTDAPAQPTDPSVVVTSWGGSSAATSALGSQLQEAIAEVTRSGHLDMSALRSGLQAAVTEAARNGTIDPATASALTARLATTSAPTPGISTAAASALMAQLEAARPGGRGKRAKGRMALRAASAFSGTSAHVTVTVNGHQVSDTTAPVFVVDGQPTTRYTQQVADMIGPVLMTVGPNPDAVLGALHDHALVGTTAGRALLAAVPTPLPETTTSVMDENQLDTLVAALRYAGAEVLSPGPDTLARQRYRSNGPA